MIHFSRDCAEILVTRSGAAASVPASDRREVSKIFSWAVRRLKAGHPVVFISGHADLAIAELTVKTYRGGVMDKMTARSVADLMRMAQSIVARVAAPPDAG